MKLDERIPEPELMDDPEQAHAYSDADFSAPHQMFVDAVVDRFPELRAATGLTILDLGCGPADVTARLALACPGCEVIGIDGSEAMLSLGRERIEALGLNGRVHLERAKLPDAGLLRRTFDALMSNSLLHHLADPATLWAAVGSCVAAGSPVAVMDLCRPHDSDELARLVDTYAAGEPSVLRRDFTASLGAAYRAGEVDDQLRSAGLERLTVEQITDRHLLVSGRR